MATPADIPRQRCAPAPEPAAAAEPGRPNRRRRRNCSHPDCHVRINQPLYACSRHWKQLPIDLQERLKETKRPPRNEPTPRDHPFRIAAREAQAIWAALAAGTAAP